MRSYFKKAHEKHAFRKAQKLKVQRVAIMEPTNRPPRHTMPSACAICQEPCDDLCADHCHKSGLSREWLCRKCNAGLGMFRDNPAYLERAAAYLRKHAPTQDLDPTRAALAAYRAYHPRA
jgi:hypothetical protein